MNFSKIKRNLGRTLSEGQGMQLLWLLIIIIVLLLLFWAIVSLIFKDGSISFGELISMFIDPGSFDATGGHAGFRFIATLSGIFLFSALLISAVSNIFENIADSFKNGNSRFKHNNHILILGGCSHVFSMLTALLDGKSSPYKNEDIVILSNQSVENLRTQIFSLSSLDKQKITALKRRLTIYQGERDNESDLRRKDLAKNAKIIYIIGEDGECASDSISIRCSDILKDICQGTGRAIRCFLLLRDPASVLMFRRNKEINTDVDLKLDVIDANEYLAERVLVVKGNSFPVIDYTINRDSSGERVITEGIPSGSDSQVNFIISGMTDIGKAMALTAAQICHFPNYREKGIRTVISFIDRDMIIKMNRFTASYSNMFELSHYRYIAFDGTASPLIKDFVPNPIYGDFLDVEWEFIDADISSPVVRKILEDRASDDQKSLSIAFCNKDGKESSLAALSLPHIVYSNKIPVYVYQKESGEVLDKASASGRFGNLHIFGMANDSNSDPLFLERTLGGQRVHYVYCRIKEPKKYSDDLAAWFDLAPAFKFNSIYSANSMHVHNHNFQLLDKDITSITEEQWLPVCEEEHRRWMTSALILGFRALDSNTRDIWTAEIRRNDPQTKKKAQKMKEELKGRFFHLNITPFDDLPPEDQKTDREIIQEIRYILS